MEDFYCLFSSFFCFKEDGVNIVGHRTTYGAWFRHVDQLYEGDEILLEFAGDKYQYSVEKVFIVLQSKGLSLELSLIKYYSSGKKARKIMEQTGATQIIQD